MARTGFKVTIYLDDNPSSSGYMQTYEERVEDTFACPTSEDNWVLISSNCEIVMSGYTGYRLLTYYNTVSGEYRYVREEDAECDESSTEEQWVNSGSPYCETTEQGLNTGYMLQLQVQMNPNLPNYGETRYQRYKSPECGGNNCPQWELVSKQCHITVANCVATFDGTADIVEIDVNPLSESYNQTRTVNKEDSDCENCTTSLFSWELVGDMCGDDTLLCENGIQEISTNSYTVSRKYKTIAGGTPIPMDEYQVVLKTEDDVNCGYIRPIYEMRRIVGQYLCDFETYTKYEKWCQYVSYDNGETWSYVVPEVCERGAVIAYDSYDCGKPMYRWIPNGEFMCEDNGDDGKLMIWNNEGKLSAYTPCDESNVLSGSETTIAPTKEVYSEYANTMQVGDCVSVVNGLPVNKSYKLWLGNYTEEINGGLGSYERRSLDIPSRVNYFNGGFPSDSSHWNSYLRTMVFHSMTPPTLGSLSGYTRSMPLTVTSQPYGITYNSGIFVPKDAYNDYLDAWSYTTFTNLIKPMNDDSISYKAIVRYESDFSTWSWYVPDGESADTIDTYEAVYGSANMTSITISDKVRTIKEGAFYRSQSYASFGAKQLDLGNGVQTIEPLAFKGNVFTDIYIPSSVRTIGYQAFGSGALTSLTIANGVQTIGDSAFEGHKLSGTIEIPDSVQTIGRNAFKGNQYVTNIEHIIIGSGCTEIYGSAFYQNKTNNVCPLKTVTIKALTPPRIYGSGSDHCGQYNTVFSSSYSQKVGSNYCNFPYGNYTIYVPCEAYEDYINDNNWSYFTRGNCKIETVFNTTRWVDSGTTCIDGGEYVVQIEQGTCDTEITTATTWYNTGNQRTTGSPIDWCGKVLSDFSDGERYSAACDDNTKLSEPCTSGYDGSKLVYSRVGDCIEVIGYSCYSYLENLSAITIGDNVNAIEESAFKGCTSLTSITLPNGVTSIYNSAFSGCTSLTSVTIGSGVTSIYNRAFDGCSAITTISCYAPYPPTVGKNTFRGLTSLERIYVPCESLDAYKSASVWSGYTDIIRGFTEERQWVSGTVCVDCDLYDAEIEQSRCDSSEPWVDTGNYRTIGEPIDFCCKLYMKYDEDSGGKYSLPCDGNPTLSSGNTHINKIIRYIKVGDCITHIAAETFWQLMYVSGITLPNSIVSIGNYAFGYCYELDGEFIIPSGVTSISHGLFYECRSLDSIVIHSGVTYIGGYAFYGCSSLTSITINATTPPTLESTDVLYGANNCTIYVPAESLDAYKTAWSDYADRITSI